MVVNPAFVLLLLLGATQASSDSVTCDGQNADLCQYVPFAKYRGFKWLLKGLDAPSERGEQFDLDHMAALLSLQLSYPELYGELKPHERQVLRSVQECAMLSALETARANQKKGDIVPYLDPVRFAQQLLAMEASCIDTKNFFGQDLQYHLSILTRDFPESNYGDLFQFAFSLLPLCSTNVRFYEKVWLKLLSVRDMERPCLVVRRDEFEGTEEQYQDHTIATLSMLVMTMRCSRNQVPEKHRKIFFERFDQRVQCIIGWHNKTVSAFGGNVRTTALALQALNAAEVTLDTHSCIGAYHYLLQSQNLDGSFGKGTIQETALVLPVLASTHLGGLWEADIECPDGRNRHNLPRLIGPFDSRKTFTLVIYNSIRNMHWYHNITIIDGENLLQALIRAKLDENIDFEFAAERFTFHGEEGIYLTSVNGVENDRRRFYHWLAKKSSSEGDELLSLDEVEPDEDSKIILAYVDITPESLRPPQLPRPITEDDESFNLTIRVTNELTGEETLHYTPIIEGENLLHALLRAWKNPWSTFNFAAEPAIIFNKIGVYLKSVNGLKTDKENFYFWLVKKESEEETEDNGSFQPIGLLEYIPRRGRPVNLAYVDISAYRDQFNPSGKGKRQLPKDIEDGDSAVDFTLVIYNNITGRKWAYNVTILEGENLLDAFLRGWKDVEMFPSFGTAVFPFFGKQSLYLTSINGVANSRENLSHWIVRQNVMPDQSQMTNRQFTPVGLTEVFPEDGGEVHVVYQDLRPWRRQFLMPLAVDQRTGMMEQLMEVMDQMDAEIEEIPRKIRDCDTTVNITVYVVNNITQAHEGFNLTIIEGEYLFQALLRAWKDPEINFNYAWDLFTLFFTPGAYPTKVNGTANNPEEYYYWLVKLVEEGEDWSDYSNPLDLTYVPRNWDEIVLVYADLSEWKEQLEELSSALPPRIEQGDKTATFTLYLINEIRSEHSGFNVTIFEGETLLDGLYRAWKNKTNYFNFGAELFNFLGKNGVFLTTVNGIANSKIDSYHWVVKHKMSEEVRLIDYQPTSLDELKPTDGSVVKLVYADISKVVEERRRHYAWGELPRLMHLSDDVFTLTLLVFNNITQEHKLYNVRVIRGENLLQALLRAWKNPYNDFNFGAGPSPFFDNDGFYLTSVNGVANDLEKFYIWFVHDVPKCELAEMEDNMMMMRMMMMESMQMSNSEFYGLEQYIPEPGEVVTLLYIDVSPHKNETTVSGLGHRELPKMIEDGDYTVNFTLFIYNSETERKWSYNMTILKGESLFDAFLRMWKKPEIDFVFSAEVFEFFGKRGLYITSINKVSNNAESKYHWIIKPNGKEETEEMFVPVDLTAFIPKDGGEAHVAYVDLSEAFQKYREHLAEEGIQRRAVMGGGEDEEILRDITACDSTANITIYVVDNTTQTKESFNLTIIEGESLKIALLRAWKDPEIDFNFAVAPFIFFFKPGVYLTSVNGLANSKENFTHWLVKKGDEEEEEDEGPISVKEYEPENGAKVILIYVDLSPYKEDLQIGMGELPRPIEEGDSTVTFTLYTIDTYRQEHMGYNITILEGETILEGLHRAWKNWDSYFNFQVAPFRFVNKWGIFPISVNGVRISRETGYHWLLLDGDADVGRKVPRAIFDPIGLTEVRPTSGSVFKLAYVDLTHIFNWRQDPLELPREIFDNDDTFTLQIFVGNNITGEHSAYNVTVIEGEPLLHGLLRAWKEPNSNFSFDVSGFKFFDKLDYFPTSVLRVANDLDKNYYWLVLDSKHEEDEMDSNFQPIGLTEYIPREGVPVKLVYLDLSRWRHQLNPTGEGRHELPKEIEEDSATINFTLNVFNAIFHKNWRYEVTILEGEKLFDAFLRLWKNPEVDFNFGAAAFEFADKFAFYVFNINGLVNQPENYFYWIVVDPMKGESSDELNPLGLRELVPSNGSEVHVVYKDLSPYKHYLGSQESIEKEEKENHGLPKEIEEDDKTLNVTIKVVNNITQTQEGFNITIIHGESLLFALLRAWKNPEINFNFAARPFKFYDKLGLYLTSVNGVANNYTNFYYWMVIKGGYADMAPKGLAEYIPQPGDKLTLVYADLSQHKAFLSVRELPRNIEDGDETLDFNLFVFNNITKQHCAYNVSVLPGEDLLDALFRTWKNPKQYFNFGAVGTTLLHKYGVFLTSVNGVNNNYKKRYHWLAEFVRTPEEEMEMKMMNSTDVMQYQPWGLVELIPMAGSDVKLIYVDLTPWEQQLQMEGDQESRGDENWKSG